MLICAFAVNQNEAQFIFLIENLIHLFRDNNGKVFR